MAPDDFKNLGLVFEGDDQGPANGAADSSQQKKDGRG